MPFASYQSEQAALSELEGALSDENRYIDLCLVFRRKATGTTILTTGGRWDRTEQHFVDPDPADLTGSVILINDNQVAVVEAFARHLASRINGTPRKPLLVTGGGRRAGKSWIVTALALAAAVALPDAIVWMVSPILDKREELERYLKRHAAAGWLTPRVREFKFTLPNGSTIKNVTGDDDASLKRGEADLVVYNEPQLMGSDVLTNGAPAVIDQGGLVMFAGNPATKRKGVWFTRLWNAIESGKYKHGEVYRLDKRDNPDTHKESAAQIGELLRLVNPDAARADEDGIFREPGDFAYAEHFDEARNTCPRLDIGARVTAAIIRRAGDWGRHDILNGVDFQGWPYNAGVSLEAVGDPSDPTWYVTGCLMVPGEEELFLDEAYGLWDRERTIWIGDASGTWQDAQHIRGRTSFDKFLARKWRIEPPQKKLSDRGEHPANPSREDRINLVNGLLARGKLIVCMDKAAPVAEALQKCEVDSKGRPRGTYAHITDALGYPLWWATPRSRPFVENGPPMVIVPVTRYGSDF